MQNNQARKKTVQLSKTAFDVSAGKQPPLYSSQEQYLPSRDHMHPATLESSTLFIARPRCSPPNGYLKPPLVTQKTQSSSPVSIV